MSGLRALPVLMYHYVSGCTGPINVTPEQFEAQCQGMAACGWRGVGLDEAEAWLRGERSLPAKSVLITFDDGFLDNHVYAAPLLRAHGHKGVVFAVTDRIEPGNPADPVVRPALERGAGNISGSADQGHEVRSFPLVDDPLKRHALGYSRREDVFMNWDEARALERDGTLAVAAHTTRHELVFASDALPPRTGDTPEAAAARFHTPGWRGNTFYRIYGDIPWGMPRFAERPAMSGPAFVPAPELVAAVRDLVPQDTAAAYAFFQDPANVRALHEVVDRCAAAPQSMGQFEDPAATRARIHTELARCAATLTHELGHAVRSLCWPWGKGSPLAAEIASACGFDVLFETRPGPALSGCHMAVPRFKVRDRSWPWLRLRLELYSRPLMGALYARMKG